MGEFSRYGSVGIQTNGNVFLLILPRGRNLFIGSPALHHAGADRLQMVGVSSLHDEESFQRTFAACYRSCQQFYTVESSYRTSSGL